MVFLHGGVFPVRRGHRDQEAFITAHTILDKGGCVLMYAEGGRSRVAQARRAQARRRAPRARVGRPGRPGRDPRIRRRARLEALRFPKVTVQFDEPMSFERVEHPTKEQSAEAAQKIFDHVRAMYVGIEEQGRWAVIKRLRKGLPEPSPDPATPPQSR